MGILEELRRNRRVFEEAQGSGDMPTVLPAPGSARAPAQRYGKRAELPEMAATPAGGLWTRAEEEADGTGLSVPTYSLQEAGPGAGLDTERYRVALPQRAMQRIPIPEEPRAQALAAVDGAVRFPTGEGPARAGAQADAADSLRRRLESEARMQSQLLEE